MADIELSEIKAQIAAQLAGGNGAITAEKLRAVLNSIADSGVFGPEGRAAFLDHDHTAAQIADATPVGRALLLAPDAATQRSLLGAGALGGLATLDSTGHVPASQMAPLSATDSLVFTRGGAGGMLFSSTLGPSGTNRVSYSLWGASGTWTNGPPGEPTYYDNVWAIGLNAAGIGIRDNPNMPVMMIHMESKYYQGPSQLVAAYEYHLQFGDTTGNVHRIYSAFALYDGSDANVYQSANWFAFATFSGVIRFDINFNTNSINVGAGMVTNYAGSGVIAYQAYAPSLTGALPSLDANGSTAIGVLGELTTVPAPGSIVASPPILRSRGATTRAGTAAAPGTATSADFYVENGATQAASGAISVTCTNSTTSTAAAGAVVEADCGRAITGANVPAGTYISDIVSATQFKTNNALPATVTSITKSARTKRSLSIGIDQSGVAVMRGDSSAGGWYFDYYSYVVWRDMAAGYAQALYADATGFFFKRPVVPPVYPFALLPIASDAIKNARAAISDGPPSPVWGAAAAGGGSQFTPVICHGADGWKNGG